MASTSILSQVTSGNSFATSAASSFHMTMACRCALLLVTMAKSLRGRDCASLNAKRMILVTPGRVMSDTSMPASSGNPLCTRPPTPEYSPSEFSRTYHPVELGPRDVAERARDAGQDTGRPDVRVLIERLADCEPQATQGYV